VSDAPAVAPVAEVPPVPPSEPAVVAEPRAEPRGASAPEPRHGSLVVGIASTVLGLGLLVVSLTALTADAGVVKYVLAGAGLAGTYAGLSQIGRRLFGPAFDLALWLSGIWLVVLILAAVFADLLPLQEWHDVSRTLTAPVMQRPDLFSAHPLGTDGQGLDILGGVIYGARVSLIVGFGAVVIGMVLGLAIGMVAGYRRGRFDTAASFLTDSMLAFPPLVLLMAMVAVMGASVANVTLGLAILSVPLYIRLARANTMVFAQRDFVLSARVLGERHRAIVVRDLLPNVVLPVVSYSFIVMAAFIVAEASLSFLGLSVSRPNPTWGNMIASGQNRFDEVPHLVFAPGTVLFLTVFAINRVGEKARALWDPREVKL
jgi:peptide/nickel transport system permease protein